MIKSNGRPCITSRSWACVGVCDKFFLLNAAKFLLKAFCRSWGDQTTPTEKKKKGVNFEKQLGMHPNHLTSNWPLASINTIHIYIVLF